MKMRINGMNPKIIHISNFHFTLFSTPFPPPLPTKTLLNPIQSTSQPSQSLPFTTYLNSQFSISKASSNSQKYEKYFRN